MRLLVTLTLGIILSIPAFSGIVCTLDVGSNTTRMVVADVSSKSIRIQNAVETAVAIGNSVQAGILPEKIIQDLTTALKAFAETCQSAGGRQIVGVATSGFRKATKNGAAVLNALSAAVEFPVDVRIIDINSKIGKEEARLGVNTVRVMKKLDPTASICMLDIGGGSQQIVVENNSGLPEVGSLALGADSSMKIATEIASGRTKENLYPLSVDEWKSFTSTITQYLKTSSMMVSSRLSQCFGIGGVLSTMLLKTVRTSGPNDCVSLEQIESATNEVSSLSIEELRSRFPNYNYVQTVPTNLQMISTVMTLLNISSICPLPGSNLAYGQLLDLQKGMQGLDNKNSH